jgi:hypothetical protein
VLKDIDRRRPAQDNDGRRVLGIESAPGSVGRQAGTSTLSMRARRLVTTALALAAVSSCVSSEPLPPVASAPVSDVSIQELVAAPAKFNGARVRVIAPALIEFEGSALYATEVAREARATHQAVWLQLKWPLLPERRALNGKYVLVEGRFVSGLEGHEGVFEGAIVDVTDLESSSSQARDELMQRIQQGL